MAAPRKTDTAKTQAMMATATRLLDTDDRRVEALSLFQRIASLAVSRRDASTLARVSIVMCTSPRWIEPDDGAPGRVALAEAMLTYVDDLQVGNRAIVYRKIGTLYQDSGRTDLALRYLWSAVVEGQREGTPERPHVYQRLARLDAHRPLEHRLHLFDCAISAARRSNRDAVGALRIERSLLLRDAARQASPDDPKLRLALADAALDAAVDPAVVIELGVLRVQYSSDSGRSCHDDPVWEHIRDVAASNERWRGWAEVCVHLARNARIVRRPDLAIEFVDRELVWLGDHDLDSMRPELLMQRARAEESNGDPDAAFRDATTAVSLYPAAFATDRRALMNGSRAVGFASALARRFEGGAGAMRMIDDWESICTTAGDGAALARNEVNRLSLQLEDGQIQAATETVRHAAELLTSASAAHLADHVAVTWTMLSEVAIGVGLLTEGVEFARRAAAAREPWREESGDFADIDARTELLTQAAKAVDGLNAAVRALEDEPDLPEASEPPPEITFAAVSTRADSLAAVPLMASRERVVTALQQGHWAEVAALSLAAARILDPVDAARARFTMVVALLMLGATDDALAQFAVADSLWDRSGPLTLASAGAIGQRAVIRYFMFDESHHQEVVHDSLVAALLTDGASFQIENPQQRAIARSSSGIAWWCAMDACEDDAVLVSIIARRRAGSVMRAVGDGMANTTFRTLARTALGASLVAEGTREMTDAPLVASALGLLGESGRLPVAPPPYVRMPDGSLALGREIASTQKRLAGGIQIATPVVVELA